MHMCTESDEQAGLATRTALPTPSSHLNSHDLLVSLLSIQSAMQCSDYFPAPESPECGYDVPDILLPSSPAACMSRTQRQMLFSVVQICAGIRLEPWAHLAVVICCTGQSTGEAAASRSSPHVGWPRLANRCNCLQAKAAGMSERTAACWVFSVCCEGLAGLGLANSPQTSQDLYACHSQH